MKRTSATLDLALAAAAVLGTCVMALWVGCTLRHEPQPTPADELRIKPGEVSVLVPPRKR